MILCLTCKTENGPVKIEFVLNEFRTVKVSENLLAKLELTTLTAVKLREHSSVIDFVVAFEDSTKLLKNEIDC